ncbi:hydrogenase-4 component E [Escherichia coli]|nr:hydrogenase-4 component E [Escherichia coli]
MENGSHLVLALLAWRAPELVEIAIATDAIFAVIVMVLLARNMAYPRHAGREHLTALKG